MVKDPELLDGGNGRPNNAGGFTLKPILMISAQNLSGSKSICRVLGDHSPVQRRAEVIGIQGQHGPKMFLRGS